jgi:asparagine N-glycosylation enzyme membrane subunit Stt3
MSYGLVGAYAIYFIFVGVHKNSANLLSFVEDNGRNFLVWILAIVILRALYNVDALRPVVKPFIGLAVLTFVLTNWNNVTSQLDAILPPNVQIPQTKS